MGNRMSNMTTEGRAAAAKEDKRLRVRTTSIQEYLRFKYIGAGRGGEFTDKYERYRAEGGSISCTVMVYQDFKLVRAQVIDIDAKTIDTEAGELFVMAADLLLPDDSQITVGNRLIAEKGYYPDWDKILLRWNY